jgi:AcrR family transcriptional regulator
MTPTRKTAAAEPPAPAKEDPCAAPRRGRPRDPERLRRILEAAREHFFAHGFERAAMDAIALDAGVSKMTVYSHFPSKELLFEAVIGARTERVVGGLPGVQSLDPKSPEKALSAIGAQFIELAREPKVLGQFRAVFAAAGSQPQVCLAFYRQGPDRLIGELAEYLRRAHAAGTLVVAHPRQAADLFLSMFLGDGHFRGLLKLDLPEPKQDRALLREAVRVFMAGYGARA